MEEIPVFVALASPILRARLRSNLARAPGIRLVGEAASAASASLELPALAPRILLTEQQVLRDPALQPLLALKPPPQVVLVTLQEEAAAEEGASGGIPTVSISLSPPELALQLRQTLIAAPKMVPPPPPPRELVPELQERFQFHGVSRPPANEGQAARSTPQPVKQPPPSPAVQAGPGRRRPPSARHEQLVLDLHSLQRHDLDTVTGMVGPGALDRVWALLPEAQQAVAFMAIEVQDPMGKVRAAPPPELALLRRISATLRANVRREDLVCRAGPATFILILPGLRRENGADSLSRFSEALADTCGQALPAGRVRLALGIGFWETSQEPTAVLMHCLHVLRTSPETVIEGKIRA